MTLAPAKLAALGLLATGALTVAGSALWARQEPPTPPSQTAGAVPAQVPKPRELAAAALPVPRPPRTGTAQDPGSDPTPQELLARLTAARERLAALATLLDRGMIARSDESYLDARAHVAILDAQIRGQILRHDEELELLKIQLRVREEELKHAMLQLCMEGGRRARIEWMSEKGVISSEERNKFEAEVLTAQTELQIKKAGSMEIEARIRHAARRLKALQGARGDEPEPAR